MRPLICHINLAGGFRGGERQTELLIHGLHALGYRQRLVALQDGAFLQRMREFPWLACEGITRPFLPRVAACRGADLIQVHEAKGGHLACFAQRLYGTPYVLARRTYKSPRPSPWNRWLYARAAGVVTVSAMIAEVLRNAGLREDATIIPDACASLPTDEEAVSAIRQRFAGKFLLGHAAALVPNKGQSVLIEAMRLLADELPDVQLLLMGQGKDEALLRQAAEGMGNVQFEGFVDNPGDYFAALDLYVHPSLSEGLGSVLLDAMQAGLPIIASRAGGIPEIIHNQVNGLLVPPGDPGALADAIRRLYLDRPLRQTLVTTGRAMIKGYSAGAMAERYARLYTALGIASV